MGQADFDLSEEEVETLSAVSMFCSALSLLGSGFIILCYVRYKHLRTFAFRLVMMLSINDFLNQVGDFLQPSAAEVIRARTQDDVTGVCILQAVTESFFELSSVLWTTAVAWFLYMSVFQHKDAQQVEASFKWMCLFCWGLPLILTIIPGAMGLYGGAGAWCWIKPGHVEWRFIQFYIPLWIAIVFNSVIYIMVIRVVQNMAKLTRSDTGNAMLQAINRLRWYPIILLIVWGFASINRVYESVTQSNLFWLTVLQKVFSSLQGLLNSIAYGASDSIRLALIKDMPFLRRVCPCCCRAGGDAKTEWARNPASQHNGGATLTHHEKGDSQL